MPVKEVSALDSKIVCSCSEQHERTISIKRQTLDKNYRCYYKSLVWWSNILKLKPESNCSYSSLLIWNVFLKVILFSQERKKKKSSKLTTKFHWARMWCGAPRPPALWFSQCFKPHQGPVQMRPRSRPPIIYTEQLKLAGSPTQKRHRVSGLFSK